MMINLSLKFLFLFLILKFSNGLSLIPDKFFSKNDDVESLFHTLSEDNLNQNLFMAKSNNGFDEIQYFLNNNNALIDKLFSQIEQPKEQTSDGILNKIFKVVQEFLPKSQRPYLVQDEYFDIGPLKFDLQKKNNSHSDSLLKLDKLVENLISTPNMNTTRILNVTNIK